MYLFRIWFQRERELIAADELREVWAAERAKLPAHMHTAFNAKYPEALRRCTYNIHPLCILGLRRKI